MSFRWADPAFLLLLIGVPAVIVVRWLHERHRKSSLTYSSLAILGRAGRTTAARLWWLPTALRLTALVLLLAAFARPQAGHAEEEMLTRGIDIVLAFDNSRSMQAEDFRPKNRLAVARDSVATFIQGRRSDRIGLVVFSGKGYTACPLTLDYEVLLSILAQVDFTERDEGTAIGMGLAVAINRLRGSDAPSKVILLVTDGRNNRGEIDPTTATALAKSLGIRIYAVGVGTRGEAPYPVDDPVLGRRYLYLRADIDDDSLKAIADATGGRYFRATDTDSLQQILREIDSLEKIDIKVRHYTRYSELFPWFAWPATGLVLLELTLAGTRLRRIP